MLRRLLLAIALCLPSFLAASHAYAACTPGGVSGFSSGSAVVGNQVVVCVNSSTASSASKSSTTKTKMTKNVSVVVAPVVVCPTSVSTTAQIVAAALLGCAIPGPSRPPTKVVVSVPKTAVNKSQAVSVSSDQAAFTPNPISIVASQSALAIGESLLLSSDAVVHERSATILGRVGYVQFVPNAYHWSSDSGWEASAPVAIATFASNGAKEIRLTVDYQASYRFSLTEPWVAIGNVSMSALAEVNVVAAPPAVQTKRAPLLVWNNCIAHPSAYRC
jgi:hypothetical protein